MALVAHDQDHVLSVVRLHLVPTLQCVNGETRVAPVRDRRSEVGDLDPAQTGAASAGSSSRMRNPRNDWDEGGYDEEPPARSSAE